MTRHKASETPAALAQPASGPAVHYHFQGCTIQHGTGTQTITSTAGPGQADIIQVQAATIAAQHRTIERLLTIIERLQA